MTLSHSPNAAPRSSRLVASVERQWYAKPSWLWGLAPLTPVYALLSKLKKKQAQSAAVNLPVPVIVVGNITAGGTGKTPLVIALCKMLQAHGWQPAVVSRGYGGQFEGEQALPYPYSASAKNTVSKFGDEPNLIAQQSGCPVVVGKDRAAAAQLAIKLWGCNGACNVIVSDDGLQHYRLGRDVEIAVVDGERGLGNGYLMPLGPLREPVDRLLSVDCIILNSPMPNVAHKMRAMLQQDNQVPLLHMTMRPVCWRQVSTGLTQEIDALDISSAVALAGIGNPQRFQSTLNTLGYNGAVTIFADHHAFKPEDLAFAAGRTLLMTAKDAIKCAPFASETAWYLEAEAVLPDTVMATVLKKIEKARSEK